MAGAFALTMLCDARKGHVLIIRPMRAKLRGFLYGAGLTGLGLAPERVLLAHARDMRDMLRAGVEAARCRGMAAVVLETWGACPEWDLTASRRFSLAAERSGVTVLVLRGDATPQPSSAQSRWLVTSAPSRALAAMAPGLPAITVELTRQRGGPSGLRWRMEWDADHGTFREAALSGAVVPLSAVRAGAEPLSPGLSHAA